MVAAADRAVVHHLDVDRICTDAERRPVDCHGIRAGIARIVMRVHLHAVDPQRPSIVDEGREGHRIHFVVQLEGAAEMQRFLQEIRVRGRTAIAEARGHAPRHVTERQVPALPPAVVEALGRVGRARGVGLALVAPQPGVEPQAAHALAADQHLHVREAVADLLDRHLLEIDVGLAAIGRAGAWSVARLDIGLHVRVGALALRPLVDP